MNKIPFVAIGYMNEQKMMSFVSRTVPFIQAINAIKRIHINLKRVSQKEIE